MVSALSSLAAWIYSSTIVVPQFLMIRMVLLGNSEIPLAERTIMYNAATRRQVLTNDWLWSILVSLTSLDRLFIHTGQPFITDGIAIWRGVVLFPQQRWGFMFALLLGMVGMGMSTKMHIRNGQPYFPLAAMIIEMGLYTHDTSSGLIGMERVGVTLSFATNLVTTGLIAYRVWYYICLLIFCIILIFSLRVYRRFLITQLNQEDQRQFRVYKILRLFLESGVVYCILQVWYMCISFL